MKKLKLLFNVSDMALTVAVFIMITALVPMEIIIRLINAIYIKGEPCVYDALINVQAGAVWRYVIPFVLFYVLYIQKYDMNSAIVLRRRNVRNVWINAQINMFVAAAFFSVYSAMVTIVAGWLMTGKICNWGEKFSRAYVATGNIVTNPPHLWLLVAIAVTSFENLACKGFLSYYYVLSNNIFTMGVSIWRNIVYPLLLFVIVVTATIVIIRRRDFFR